MRGGSSSSSNNNNRRQCKQVRLETGSARGRRTSLLLLLSLVFLPISQQQNGGKTNLIARARAGHLSPLVFDLRALPPSCVRACVRACLPACLPASQPTCAWCSILITSRSEEATRKTASVAFVGLWTVVCVRGISKLEPEFERPACGQPDCVAASCVPDAEAATTTIGLTQASRLGQKGSQMEAEGKDDGFTLAPLRRCMLASGQRRATPSCSSSSHQSRSRRRQR